MSALRLGRNPDGTRQVVVIDEGAVGRVTHARASIMGGEVVVAESERSRSLRLAREADKRKEAA